MSYYDSDLKAVLAQFHSQSDTDTRKDILKKLSNNQLSRVVIQGVKCEFEREGLEEIALAMLDVISRDPHSNLAHNVHEENGVAVKHEEADGECEVVIKMEELEDDDGVTMIKSESHDNELAPDPGPSTIASVSINPNPKRGRGAQDHPGTFKERPTHAEGTESASRGSMPKFYPRGYGQIGYLERTRNRGAARGPMHEFYPRGHGQAAYLERFSNRDAAQARYPFLNRPRWRV
ncbi:uncharacterized protein J4E87_004607 [Alternaria ethzedia]|uniref:uncharacterized protein n=1 Tax=Alternaria ethzedia TaxID=181014 RepID=UPI0020C4A738|nr:uncharacterized protein J4E87_004607 [Alternaria ethzedia]KAI4626107.1 hypothetical protein J4E87_004607 [Alternaria ethzedia]